MYVKKVIITKEKLYSNFILNEKNFNFMEKIVKLILFLVHDYYDEILENVYSLIRFSFYLKDKNHRSILS